MRLMVLKIPFVTERDFFVGMITTKATKDA